MEAAAEEAEEDGGGAVDMEDLARARDRGLADAQEEAVDLGLWRFDSPRAATSFLRPLFVLYRESLKQIYRGCM